MLALIFSSFPVLQEDEYAALCDRAKYAEAVRRKQGRVHDNLHLMLDLEEPVLQKFCCGERRMRPHLLLR